TAWNNRIAIDATISRALEPVGITEIAFIDKLVDLGCRIEDLCLETVARSLIGQARYQPNARWVDAPGIVDCSSYVGWVLAQVGIWLPRYTLELLDVGQSVAL